MSRLIEKLWIKESLLVISEYGKEEYVFLLELVYELFLTGTVDLLVMSQNDAELVTNVLSRAPVLFAKQHLTLLLETVRFRGNKFIDRC